MKMLFDLAMDTVQSTIASQKDDNQLTQNESKLFTSAMRVFFAIAIGTDWPAHAYLKSLDGLLESGWRPAGESNDVNSSQTADLQRVVRPKKERNFSFSESFTLGYPDTPKATISISGGERHDNADFENAGFTLRLPREFWNVSVTMMASEVLWRAGQSGYSRKKSDYSSLNHVRPKGRIHYENSKFVKVSGNTSTGCRDGRSNHFDAAACGQKLAADEIPIEFKAWADSRML